ncbi:RING-H2 finger protein ATL20-like [Humulus lupulus]|uniref:RING-H2 finger protein ATL20-like n=1 Tax=Humulus lupulus TaxID=3486 RepID=UPI002B40D0E0|nr:RING-H2 finger protein ATL20-like [Humulus lupulus]
MAAYGVFSFFFVVYFFRSHVAAANIKYCGVENCNPLRPGPKVHFPFWLRNSSQTRRCSYRTEFDLSCNEQRQTILRLGSGEFTVQQIDYEGQSIFINDPAGCLPKRFMNREFDNFSATPFTINRMENYTFFNCSKDFMAIAEWLNRIDCLSGQNREFAVVAVPTEDLQYYRHDRAPTLDSPSPSPSPSSSSPSPTCSVITTAMVPRSFNPFSRFDRFSDITGSIQLAWSDPNCRDCVERGGKCGFQSGSDTRIGCSVSTIESNHGLPRTAKYGIIIGVGIPGLLCIIGLASFICGRVRECGQRRRRPFSDYTGPEHPTPVMVVMGYDGPTIESFPKIELGESKRLPKPNDTTCPICLCEYEPKDTLRTIPECNHYYHASCVDEWLKMNATCPLCRNSPDTDSASSSHVSPSTSVSHSSSSFESS